MKNKILITFLVMTLCLIILHIENTGILNAQSKEKEPQPPKEDKQPVNENKDKGIKESIEKSLKYLVKSQAQDGSWGGQFTIAITGISGLAFLAYDAKPFDSAYSDTILKTKEQIAQDSQIFH